MKYRKMILGALIPLLLLLTPFVVNSCDCGCFDTKDAPPETAIHVSTDFWRVSGETDKHEHVRTYEIQVDRWYFEGHDYIQFRDSRYYGIAWIHDPNCRCHNQSNPGTNLVDSSGLTEYQKIFGGF